MGLPDSHATPCSKHLWNPIMERVGWGSHQPGRAGVMRSAEWVDLHRLLESSQSARAPGIAEQKKQQDAQA